MKPLETKGPSPSEIRAACERINVSPGFKNSDRMVRFLRFVVEKTLEGQESELKEYLLGVEVFDRPESFDPKTDTIVRVEARRLRRKLSEYYATEGLAETLRIEMPQPGYVPVFTQIEDQPAAPPEIAEQPPIPTSGSKSKVLLTVGAIILVAFGFAAWWRWSQSNVSGIDSIAVLPFSDMSATRDQEYFCEGFTEELISTLASVEGLRVVARTSVYSFKGKPGDIREIGRTLNAGVVLEGSVRRSEGTLRITAQLIRTSDGYHIWAKSYDRKAEDVLAVQQEIAQLITITLRKQMVTGNRGDSAAPKLGALDLYMLGRYHWNRLQPGDMEKAIEYFENAIAVQPNFAQAYSGLADTYSYMIDGDMAPTAEILPKARAAADKALELDPNLAEAHTARGLVAHELEWDQVRARKEFLRAIELKPSYAYGIHWYAHFLEFEGKTEEAEATMRKALAIDPLSRIFTIDLAMMKYKQRHFDEALRFIDRAEELDPAYYMLDVSRSMIFQARRDWSKAREALRKAKRIMGDLPFLTAAQAQTEALAGNRPEAISLLRTLQKAASNKAYVPDHLFGLVHYALGDPAQGRVFLKKGIDAHNGLLVWMRSTPVFDQIAADPEGKKLLMQVGGSIQ